MNDHILIKIKNFIFPKNPIINTGVDNLPRFSYFVHRERDGERGSKSKEILF